MGKITRRFFSRRNIKNIKYLLIMGRASSRWITKGIKVSCQRMRFLNNFKRNLTLTSKVLNYITRHHSVYKRVISEGEKKKKC